MSNPNKKNKYGWDRRRTLVAVIAGIMCLLLILPILAQILTYATL